MFIHFAYVIFLNIVLDATATAGKDVESGKKNGLETEERFFMEIQEHNWPQLMTGEWLLGLCAKNCQKCKKVKHIGYQLAMSSVGSNLKMGIINMNLSGNLSPLRSGYDLPTLHHVVNGTFCRLDVNMDQTTLYQLIKKRECLSARKKPFQQHRTFVWSCLSVLVNNVITLWKSDAIGEDFNTTLWFSQLMLTTFLTMMIWLGYSCWRTAVFIIHCFGRLRYIAAIRIERNENEVELVYRVLDKVITFSG